MLNKSHPISRYKVNSGKNLENVWCILTLMLGSLSLAINTRYNFVTNFFQQSLSDWLYFLIGWMILMKEMFPWKLLVWKWVNDILTVITATVAKKKNTSLGNFMLNHPGHVTFTSWRFLKFLPVVGIIEIWKSRKYWPLTPRASDFMAFFKNEK